MRLVLHWRVLARRVAKSIGDDDGRNHIVSSFFPVVELGEYAHAPVRWIAENVKFEHGRIPFLSCDVILSQFDM